MSIKSGQLHPQAGVAAKVIICVAAEGKARPFLERAFKQQEHLGRGELIALASTLGVSDDLDRCIDSAMPTTIIDADRALAERLNLRGTPAFVIGREVVRGMAGVQRIEDLLREKHKQSTASRR